MIFTRLSKASRPSSALALALVLAATGTAGVFALEQPASAQKKKKDKKADEKNYSKGFIAAYEPVAANINSEAPDWAAAVPAIPSLKAAIETDDDRMVVGNTIYTIGNNTENRDLQLEGVEMMLASNKVPAEALGQYNLLAGQLSYNDNQYAKARDYILKAIDLGYTESEPEGLVAESYFSEENFDEGLSYLLSSIAKREAAGEPVSEQWVRRGLQMSYNNQKKAELGEFALLFAKHFPSEENWGEVIAITAYGGGWQNPEILDLMRLAREANALRDERMYADYIDSADYRRLPGEVQSVIDEGYAKGTLPRSDSYVAEIYGMASDRAKTDKADLPGILTGAQGASDLRTIMTGADLALSYGDYAAAESLYAKALGMAGANADLVHTRLGIAQLEQGKISEAQENFNAVGGQRSTIARLWAAYAGQQGGM